MKDNSLDRRETRLAPPVKGLDANKCQLLPFTPTTKQRTYLVVLLEATASGSDTTDRALGKRVHVHHTTISHWREDDHFNDWLDQQVRRVLSRGLNRVLLRAYTLALKGSIRHMDLFARFSGQASGDSPSGPGAALDDMVANYQVNILVPRPQELETRDQGA